MKSASRDFLLLQKAECFLLRRIVKTRDAFDVRLLKDSGAVLDQNLKSGLTDTLMSWEVGSEDIVKRIEQVDARRCTAELQPVLPQAVFETLAEKDSSLFEMCCMSCTQISCSEGDRWIG